MAMVAEASRQLRDPAPEAVLYERTRAIAHQICVSCSIICNRSIHFWCGVLAATLRRWDEAEDHFQNAVATNERIVCRPFVVRRSRRAWAGMLIEAQCRRRRRPCPRAHRRRPRRSRATRHGARTRPLRTAGEDGLGPKGEALAVPASKQVEPALQRGDGSDATARGWISSPLYAIFLAWRSCRACGRFSESERSSGCCRSSSSYSGSAS